MTHVPTAAPAALYTEEAQLTRALAAEFRADLGAAGRLVRAVLGVDYGTAISVGIETVVRSKLDIHLTFAGDIEVGVEAKVDASFSDGQAVREYAAVNGGLILLVDEAQDADATVDEVRREHGADARVGVTTWRDVLDALDRPRITLDDVAQALRGKQVSRRAYRALRATAAVQQLVDAGWTWDPQDGGSGRPSLLMRSPAYAGGRVIVLQIEDSRAEGFVLGVIGVDLEDGDLEPFAEADETTPRLWLAYANRVGRLLEAELRGTSVTLSSGSARTHGIPSRPLTPAQLTHHRNLQARGDSRRDQARAFQVPLRRVAGFLDGYVGVRTTPVAADDLAPFTERLLQAAYALHDDLSTNAVDPVELERVESAGSTARISGRSGARR